MNIFRILVSIISLLLCTHLSQAQLASKETSCKYGVCLISDGILKGHALNEPFAMHSVMKFPQAIYVADWMKRNNITLDDSVLVRKSELMQSTWSPMLSIFDDEKYFQYSTLIALSLAQSDNNACDILFELSGSPEKVEHYMEELGFKDIHVRLTEQDMASNPEKSSENNCTPREMARLLEWFYEHKDGNEYLRFVWQTMAECKTGLERLPATLPDGAKIIHKTGTGFSYPDQTRDRNDAGIVLLPNGEHYTIVVFAPKSKEESDVARFAKYVNSTEQF